MHPIERLRYVARSSGAPQAVLVRETASALGSLAFDPAGLVTACRDAKDYVSAAIAAADQLAVGHGHGPLHHFYAQWRKS